MSLNMTGNRARQETKIIFDELMKEFRPEINRALNLYVKRYLKKDAKAYIKLRKSLSTIIMTHYKRTARLYIKRTINSAKTNKKTISQDIISEMILWASKNALKKSVSIARNYVKDVKKVEKRVKEQIESGIIAGEGTAILTKKILSVAKRLADYKAQTIALTEVGQAAAEAEQKAIKNLGLDIKSKEWINSGLDNSRDTHVEANGQVKLIDQPFDVGADLLMYARDPGGSAEEVIGCQCDTLYYE